MIYNKVVSLTLGLLLLIVGAAVPVQAQSASHPSSVDPRVGTMVTRLKDLAQKVEQLQARSKPYWTNQQDQQVTANALGARMHSVTAMSMLQGTANLIGLTEAPDKTPDSELPALIEKHLKDLSAQAAKQDGLNADGVYEFIIQFCSDYMDTAEREINTGNTYMDKITAP